MKYDRSYILKFKTEKFKYESTYLDGTCIIENFLIECTLLRAEHCAQILLLIQNTYIYKQIYSKHKCVKNKNQTFV